MAIATSQRNMSYLWMITFQYNQSFVITLRFIMQHYLADNGELQLEVFQGPALSPLSLTLSTPSGVFCLLNNQRYEKCD